jgi:hypothetical protein
MEKVRYLPTQNNLSTLRGKKCCEPMNKSALICVICVPLRFLSCSLFAQQQIIDTAKIYEIKEVTITAPQSIEIIPPQKLSGEDLQRLNSHSIADAIRYFSGIQIKDFGGIGGMKTVDLRSMGTNQVGVFYDGVQLGNAQNGQVDLGKFSLDNIEEVSLHNGQKSEIFQPAKDFGSTGSIYLRTRRPTFEENKKVNIRTIFRTGSFGLANPSFLWEQKISRSDARQCITTSINTEYIYSTGKYKFRYRRKLSDGTVAYDTSAVRKNGDIQAFRVEGGIFGSAKKIEWNAKIYFYNSERGIPGAIVNNVWYSSERQWDRNFFAQASLAAPIHRRYELLAHFKYAHDYLRFKSNEKKKIDNYYTQQEVYASIANKVNILKRWNVSLATDFQWNTLYANLDNFTPPQRYTALAALATAFDIWRIKTLTSVLCTYIHDKVDRSGLKIPVLNDTIPSVFNKYAFTPAIFISCKPVKKEEFHIRAFYKHIFRMPTFNDLYYTEIGNITLRPEYATQYNLGLHYTKIFKKGIIETLSIKVDVYYNKIKDKIVAIPKSSTQFRWMMENIDLVKIRGIDAFAQLNWKFKYSIRIQTKINYTYQKAQDFSEPKEKVTYKGQIAYIPRHSGSFTLNITFRTYEFNYCFVYIGDRYHTSANIRENYEQPWYTHDLSLGKEFCFKKWKFKVSAEVNNILNQQYEVVPGYPMPGTNFRMVLRFNV